MRESKLSTEKRNALIVNNKKISELLEENERIIESAGFNPPIDNFVFLEDDEHALRIQVPKRYIRSKNYFMKEYDLMKICDGNIDKASNIAYSLEMSDFNNFILNRIGIYGPVLAMMYKQSTINLVSIMEMFVFSYIETMRQRCKNCPVNKCCEMRISKNHKRNRFQDQISIFKEIDLLEGISISEYNGICELYDYRNHIHLGKSTENEFTKDTHSVEQHNEAMKMLKKINTAMKIELDADVSEFGCRRFAEKEGSVTTGSCF